MVISDDLKNNGSCYTCISQNLTDNVNCSGSSPSNMVDVPTGLAVSNNPDFPAVCVTITTPINQTGDRPFFVRKYDSAASYFAWLDLGLNLTSGCRILKDPEADDGRTLIFCICGSNLCNKEPPQDFSTYQNPYGTGVDVKSIVNVQPSQTQMAQMVAVQAKVAPVVMVAMTSPPIVTSGLTVSARTTLAISGSINANQSSGNSTVIGHGFSVTHSSILLQLLHVILCGALLLSL